ncbi:hypothetical protein B0H13DRAFT_2414330 [Mycena leptocephala]|nr:hypothetical protein B0H13DRAFT_2414330 [Mycena leptocephala]
MSSFESQPVEIIDHILEHIPDQSDLVALSFASPVIARVVIPRHLPSPLRLQILSLELVSQADTARIHLYGQPVASLPDTNVVENADIDQIIPALLREMTNLRGFHWNVAGIPPSAEIFAALQSSAPSLECVRIHSLRPYGHNDVPDQWFLRNSPLWKLSNLTCFSYAVSSLTNFYNKGPYVEQLLAMLIHCPMLEELELLLAHDQPTDLRTLFHGRWPRLKSLFLGVQRHCTLCRPPPSSKPDVQAFFAAHPALECLYVSINVLKGTRPLSYPWDNNNSPAASFSIGSLPNLKTLHVPQNILTLVDPDACMPQLQHLRCVEAEPSCLPGFRELTQSAPNITSIWLGLFRKLTLPGVKSYFECLPHLEKLYLLTGPRPPYYVNPLRDWNRPMARGTRVVYDGPTRTVPDPLADVLDALSVLTRLTHLANFIMFHADEGLDALVDPVVRQLAATLPRLAFVEVLITSICPPAGDTGDVLKEGTSWLAIQRDVVSGVCIGWDVVADAEKDGLELDHRSWGGLKWLVDETRPRDHMDDW